MPVFDSPSFDHHRSLVFATAPEVGLKAIIAIHSLYDGRAGGGIRFNPYDTEQAAIEDVLRLSRGMTYKFALARIPMGGAKSVIIGDPKTQKTPELLQSFARIVDGLAGKYICGPDVGTNDQDIELISQTTPHALGRASHAGDPSPATALGVFHGMLAALAHQRGSDSLEGVHVTVQGLGSVGANLCALLTEAGARLTVADIDAAAVADAMDKFDAASVPAEQIWTVPSDVFAPCAVGGVINDQSINQLGAGIICGAANNQLLEDRHGQLLHDRGVLFVPDYAVNSGGAIKCLLEGPDYDEAVMVRKVMRVRDTVAGIIDTAARDNIPTSLAADRIAEDLMAKNASHYG